MGWLWDSAGQLFTTDFWGRMLTRPWEAVIADPALALKSGAVAGAATLAGGLAIMAAPPVAGAAGTALGYASYAIQHPLLTASAVAGALPGALTTVAGVAARHPAASALVADAVMDAFAGRGAAAPAQAAPLVASPAPAPAGPFGGQMQAMFAW